jgi:hypothetical protein
VQAVPANPAKERCEHRSILFILFAERFAVNETAFQRSPSPEAEAPLWRPVPEEIRSAAGTRHRLPQSALKLRFRKLAPGRRG